MKNYIVEDLCANEAFYNLLIQKLTDEAVSKVNVLPVNAYMMKVTNQEGKLIAGLAGYDFYGSFNIDALWVERDFRFKKIGSYLLKTIENYAFQKKLSMITVSTMEWWDNIEFYKKNGFVIEFVREGFQNNYKQYHLKKAISF